MSPNIVLVDDESEILDLQVAALEGIGFRAEVFTDPPRAWDYIRQRKIDLVITDCNMPGMSGMDLLFKTRSLEFPPDVIILTGFGTVPMAVKAMSQGAISFLEKPFNISNYQMVVEQAVRRHQQLLSPAVTVQRPGSGPRKTVFRSRQMEQVLQVATSAARTDATVLLTGESGTGKEVLADYIHTNSNRSKNPFVKVNCGALPEHLIESELFGHEKGAFTGADKRNIGRFEQAGGGTLFLDEIGDLALPLQVKLLRALQEKVIERLGSTTPIPVNFRLICATHRDLKSFVAHQQFREDLYYRINVMPIFIPALRDRPDDIGLLAQHFFTSLRMKMQSGPEHISDEALAVLQGYSWPGNVRQLRNAIEYALILCTTGSILKEHLPEEVRNPSVQTDVPVSPATASAIAAQAIPKPPSAVLKQSVKEAESLAILAALERNKWRMTQTARDLGISRSTLYTRMTEFKIKRE